jgi:hypothetical protein
MRIRTLLGQLLPGINVPPADQVLFAVMSPEARRAVRHLHRALGRWMTAVDRALEHGQAVGPWEIVPHVPPILRPGEELPADVFPPRRPLEHP